MFRKGLYKYIVKSHGAKCTRKSSTKKLISNHYVPTWLPGTSKKIHQRLVQLKYYVIFLDLFKRNFKVILRQITRTDST